MQFLRRPLSCIEHVVHAKDLCLHYIMLCVLSRILRPLGDHLHPRHKRWGDSQLVPEFGYNREHHSSLDKTLTTLTSSFDGAAVSISSFEKVFSSSTWDRISTTVVGFTSTSELLVAAADDVVLASGVTVVKSWKILWISRKSKQLLGSNARQVYAQRATCTAITSSWKAA